MDLILAIINHFIGYNDVKLYKELFLPGSLAQAGGKWAIPTKFDMKLQESPDTGELYLPEIEKEFVYDLEPSRYPHKVQLDEDLPNRMLEDLRTILGEQSVSPDLRHTWRDFKAFIGDTIRSKEETVMKLYSFWIFVLAYVESIDTTNKFKLKFGPSSKDQRGGTDANIAMDSETIIISSAIEPALADSYAKDLVNMASRREPSIFEGDLPEAFLGHEAVLSKLCYPIMDGHGQGTRWAMLYGGNTYIIYLVVPTLVGSTRRCTLISSGVLYIDDTRYPFLALMLYMLLSGPKSHQELGTILDIQLETSILSSSRETPVEPRPVDPLTLVNSRSLYLTTLLEPSVRLPFFRFPGGSQGCKGKQDNCMDANTLLLRHLITDDTSIVYQANGYIVKTALPTFESYLEHEVKVYHHLAQYDASRVVPTLYGYFCYRNTKVAILSDVGPTIKDFGELAEVTRVNIFNVLLEIHRAHVVIEDFDPNNVIITKHGPIICGFTRASIDHICSGITECAELTEARNILMININNLLTDVGPKALPGRHDIQLCSP